VATDVERARKALSKLRLSRKDDFKRLSGNEGYGVTVRTIDPPLHEFLPRPRGRRKVSKKIGVSTDKIMRATRAS